MILIILEIPRLKRHQAQDGGLFGFAGYIVGSEGFGRVIGGCFGGGAFPGGWGVVTGVGCGCDGEDLGFC